MNKKKTNWQGLTPAAAAALAERDYSVRALGQRIAESGVEGGLLAAANRAAPEIAQAWIPGVEVFARTIYPQRHRGSFGEFARRDEGPLVLEGPVFPG